jgi:hypothetical protein
MKVPALFATSRRDYQTTEPVAKPLVLQLAGGAKLRPTEAGFGVTSYESTNYSSIAEDGERSGAVVLWGFAIASTLIEPSNRVAAAPFLGVSS